MKPVALVTGGSRGIGLGISRILLEHGYNIAFNGTREKDRVKDVWEELNAVSGDTEAIYCRADISSATDRESMLAKIRNRFGRLNVLVNNAGEPRKNGRIRWRLQKTVTNG